MTEPASTVESRDGTEIAYWTTGKGPPLVVVHGTPADHTRWRPLLPYLEPHFTVTPSTDEAAAPAATHPTTHWSASSKMSPRSWTR
jgi:pimeloyl-ACP methyl ester carboxylesterase